MYRTLSDNDQAFGRVVMLRDEMVFWKLFLLLLVQVVHVLRTSVDTQYSLVCTSSGDVLAELVLTGYSY